MIKMRIEGVNCPEGQSSEDCLGALAEATLPPDEEDPSAAIRSKVTWTTRLVWNTVLPGTDGQSDLKMMYWEDAGGNPGPAGQYPPSGSDVYIPAGVHVVLDYDTPSSFNKLVVQGTLEIENVENRVCTIILYRPILGHVFYRPILSHVFYRPILGHVFYRPILGHVFYRPILSHVFVHSYILLFD